MPQSIQITEDSPLLHDANCVYCHVNLDLGDRVIVCNSCHSPHHDDCWHDNGNRCSTFGCVESGASVSANELETTQSVPPESADLNAGIENMLDTFLDISKIAMALLFGFAAIIVIAAIVSLIVYFVLSILG